MYLVVFGFFASSFWCIYIFFPIYHKVFSNFHVDHVECKLQSIADVAEGNC